MNIGCLFIINTFYITPTQHKQMGNNELNFPRYVQYKYMIFLFRH